MESSWRGFNFSINGNADDSWVLVYWNTDWWWMDSFSSTYPSWFEYSLTSMLVLLIFDLLKRGEFTKSRVSCIWTFSWPKSFYITDFIIFYIFIILWSDIILDLYSSCYWLYGLKDVTDVNLAISSKGCVKEIPEKYLFMVSRTIISMESYAFKSK